MLGEGAGVIALERGDFAHARGARIYGKLAGAGISSDGYHITSVDPEGRGVVRAITAALRVAGIDKADVAHVNCHATSTPAGDVTETVAIGKAIGDHPVLTAPKSALGHLPGAAGAVEGLIVLSVRDDIVPATLDLNDIHPGVRHDVVTGDPRKTELGAVVSDSIGFGGHNVALVFTKA